MSPTRTTQRNSGVLYSDACSAAMGARCTEEHYASISAPLIARNPKLPLQIWDPDVTYRRCYLQLLDGKHEAKLMHCPAV